MAFGTPLRASGTEPWLYLDRPQGYLAVLVLFVGRRYYLRPIIPWNARRALAAIETEPFLALSGPHLGASVPPSCLNVRLPAEPLSLQMIPLRIAIIKIVLEVNK